MALQKRNAQGGFRSQMMLINKPPQGGELYHQCLAHKASGCLERSHVERPESKKLKKPSCIDIYIWKTNLICLNYTLFSSILSGYYYK